ncbi:hypothetical protein ELG78_09155 [Rhizobium leguminosarum]|uniref:hypothetical protein n=1 Tax=Rhizobium leguminosarum TaxID=384 RepID=UPI0010325DCC|nr:hypothetical protein [Rhizobium leguminosarum]TBG37136.1 hypothetical protein ELG78_09155 [Rhizobium leguminosarum]
MAHTPTPWSSHLYMLGDATAESASGRPIATLHNSEFIDTGQRIANADFIVRACNAHDELLSACLGVRAMLEGMGQLIPAMLENAITIGQGETVGFVAAGGER